ncbi:uncharacterized protein LOC144453456 [Glandiceps talaboti]
MDQESDGDSKLSSAPDESKTHSDTREDSVMNSDPKDANDSEKPDTESEEARPDVYGGGDSGLERGGRNGAGDGLEGVVKDDTETVLGNEGAGDGDMTNTETGDKPQSNTDPDLDKEEEERKAENVTPTVDEDDSESADTSEFTHPETLDSHGKSKLFERGKQFEQKGKRDHALSCYLGCLTGLTQSNQFPMLPACLHQIADIYFEKEEYEKAVQFIQAEKLYYETALVDITQLKQKLEQENQDKSVSQDNTDNGNDDDKEKREDVMKATEFENLAKLCLQEGNTQLALEYCGKATKILQAVYGEDHPKTIKSFDLYTVIYAEVGKKQYADAMKKFGIDGNKTGQSPEQDQKSSSEKESTVRFRGKEKPKKDDTEREKSSGLTETEPQIEYEPIDPEQQDDYVSTVLMMLVFFLVTVLLSLLVTYMYCSYTQSTTCASIKSELIYYYMRMKYHYYYYFKSNQGNTYM